MGTSKEQKGNLLRLIQKRKHDKGEQSKNNLKQETEIETMEHSIVEHYDPILLNQLETAKVELDEFYNYVTEGSIVRRKVTRFEHREKSSKYFLAWRKK